MKAFVHRAVLFFLPLVLFASLPWWILHQGRENLDIDRVLSRKQNDWLIGYAYRQKVYKYLKAETIRRRPRYDVIAMGSSRTLQFRDYMFTGRFFTAGTACEKLPEFPLFYSMIPPEKKPAVIIMGLDQWLLNENYNGLQTSDPLDVYLRNPTRAGYYRFHKVWGDLFAGKIDLRQLLHRPEPPIRIGLQSILKDAGYRPDGSHRNGTLRDLSISVKERLAATHALLDQHRARFQWGREINPDALTALADFLRQCRADGVHVVGFLPPFADEIWSRMIASGNYEYLKSVFPCAQAVFSEFDFPLFDFSSMSHCGSSDEEALDGFHGSEKSYLRILEIMAHHDPVLAQYVNEASVRNYLEQSQNPFYIDTR